MTDHPFKTVTGEDFARSIKWARSQPDEIKEAIKHMSTQKQTGARVMWQVRIDNEAHDLCDNELKAQSLQESYEEGGVGALIVPLFVLPATSEAYHRMIAQAAVALEQADSCDHKQDAVIVLRAVGIKDPTT